MIDIPLATQTLFADLLQRCLDAEFDDQFPETGHFKRVTVKGVDYWYFVTNANARRRQSYVGPVADPEISSRVARFGTIKADFKQRQEIVRALAGARLPEPDTMSGKVVAAFWKAGLFRLRGVLVGSVAYQCYAGLLGIKLPSTSIVTQDVDFAQFYSISQALDDQLPPALDVLRTVDPTFAPIHDASDRTLTASFVNQSRYRVDFLTDNQSGDDHSGHLSKMPALGAGIGAQPLRHMDFLMHQPERSVLLFAGGVPVLVPAPERYAVHKLLLAVSRGELAVKAVKDIMQAQTLIDALLIKRPAELAAVWQEARDRGPKWRAKLTAAAGRLSETIRERCLRQELKF